MSQLQTNDAVLAKLARDSPIAIAVSTLVDGKILDVNDSFLHVFGYIRDELIGQTSVGLEMWAEPSQRAALTPVLMAGKPLRAFAATVRTKSGTERQVLATVSDVDIAAPGACIRSTALGSWYAELSGTSMAAPHVTGAVALYLAETPAATPSDVRGWLLDTASRPQGPPKGFTGDPDTFPEPELYLGPT